MVILYFDKKLANNFIHFGLWLLFSLVIISTSYCQTWTNHYTHNQPIKYLAINGSNDLFAIADEDGVTILDENNESIFLSEMIYEFPEAGTFRADFRKVLSLQYIDDYLYVATGDSNLVAFDQFKYASAIPFMYIHDDGIDDNDQYTATFDFGSDRYFGDIDVIDLKLDVYGEFGGEDFYNIDVRDISLEDIFSTIDVSSNAIINLTQSNTELNINTFNMDELPFSEFREIEAVNLVQYKDDDGFNVRRFNMWALTDVGLALYSSDNGAFDFKDWKEENWIHFNKDNSWLLSNHIEGLQRMNVSNTSTDLRHYFIAYSNDPLPVLYLFDAKGESACVFNFENSLLNSQDSINSVYQDGNRNIFVAQGDNIHRLRIEGDVECSNSTSVNEKIIGQINKIYPNPTEGIINIDLKNQLADFKIYNMIGEMVCHGLTDGSIDVESLTPGVYFLKVNEVNYGRIIKR